MGRARLPRDVEWQVALRCVDAAWDRVGLQRAWGQVVLVVECELSDRWGHPHRERMAHAGRGQPVAFCSLKAGAAPAT
eukprot:3417081-Pyramimonas_sp.AAC.1